jgi:hypothetical protein
VVNVVQNYVAGDGGGVFRLDVSDTTSADNSGTIIVDASSKRWKRQYTGSLNVRWFGARGNNSTDDTTALQNAITTGAGGEVFFPVGTYLTTGLLIVSSNTMLRGTGATSLLKSNNLSYGSASGHCFLNLTNLTNVRVVELAFDNTAQTSWSGGMRCIYASGCTDVVVERCRFATGGAATAFITCSKYWILNNDVTISALDGVAHHDGIIDNWWGSNRAVIAGNRITGAGYNQWGILVTGDTGAAGANCYDYQIVHNQISGVSKAGIWSQGRRGRCTNIIIANNKIETISGAAGNGYGIAITETERFQVIGNVMRSLGAAAIRLSQEDISYGAFAAQRGVVVGNVIEDGNTTANTGIDSGSAIIVTDSSQYVFVSDNIVKGSTHRAIVRVSGTAANVQVGPHDLSDAGVAARISEATVSSSNLTSTAGGTTYSVTYTNAANVSATASLVTGRWWRDGNYIYLEGGVRITPTAGATATSLRISLPITPSPAFSVGSECIGMAVSTTGGLVPASIAANVANNDIVFRCTPPDTTARDYYWQARYKAF